MEAHRVVPFILFIVSWFFNDAVSNDYDILSTIRNKIAINNREQEKIWKLLF
jgi:hypothetical protein